MLNQKKFYILTLSLIGFTKPIKNYGAENRTFTKRLIHFFAFTFALLTMGTEAQATGYETINGLRFLINTETKKASLVANNPVYSGDIVVPEKITSGGQDYPVTSLGDLCFHGCSRLTSIVIPSSVTSFGDYCFCDCSRLTSIAIPSSVTSFGNYCFYDCQGLTSIDIPSSVTSLGHDCFAHCPGLISIDIPTSVTSLADYCFYECSGLTSITIPASITSLGNFCFFNCAGLTSIDIPSSVTSLRSYCFEYCYGLTSMTIPSSVASLGDCCFKNCYKLTSIDIPSSVTSLGSYCFYSCYGLTSIIIPSSITSLGSYCFNDCYGLTSIICYATIPPKCPNYCFDGVNKLQCKLFVPQRSRDQYKYADGWKNFSYIYANFDPTSITTTFPRGIITTCNNGVITITGLAAQENVTFYSVSGEQLATVEAVDGTATYAVNTTGEIVIAKFGGSSIKIVTR